MDQALIEKAVADGVAKSRADSDARIAAIENEHKAQKGTVAELTEKLAKESADHAAEIKALRDAQAARIHVPGMADSDEVKTFNIALASVCAESGNWKDAPREREVVKAYMNTEGGQEIWHKLCDSTPFNANLVRKDMNASDDPKGGFMVPPAVMAARLIPILRQKSALTRLGCTILPDVIGEPIELPRVKTTTTPTHVKETDAMSTQDLALEQIQLRPHLLTTALAVSFRFLKNCPVSGMTLFESILTDDIGQQWDKKLIKSSGAAGDPVGLLDQPGLGSVTFSVALSASGAYDKLCDMMSTLGKAGALDFSSDSTIPPSVRWLMSVTSGWENLAKIKDPTDNSQPKSRRVFSEGPFKAMLGLPYVATDNVPAQNLLLGDWPQYAIAMWGGMAVYIDRLTVNRKLENQILISMEYDGIPMQPAAFCKGASISA